MRDRALKKELAAEILSQAVSTLADPRWRRRVGLRATKVGRSLRFLESDIQSLLRRGLEHHRAQEGLRE
jgi:hypothetical protein